MLPRSVQRALRALAADGIVAYPTEGVWGLGCDPANPWAVGRLLAAKRRAADKGLILIAANFESLAPYVEIPSQRALRRALSRWPGPTTWLFPASEYAPPWITGAHTGVAVRVTAHPVAARLCRAWGGALVSTSANRSGEPPAAGPTQVRLRFRNSLDALVPGPLGGHSGPTTIRDLATGHIIRA